MLLRMRSSGNAGYHKPGLMGGHPKLQHFILNSERHMTRRFKKNQISICEQLRFIPRNHLQPARLRQQLQISLYPHRPTHVPQQ